MKATRIVTPLEYAREFGGTLTMLVSRPHDYADLVLWLIDGVWVHKGWLMPQIGGRK